MNTNNKDRHDLDDSDSHRKVKDAESHVEKGQEPAAASKEVPGDEIENIQEKKESRRRHQEHGNRRYKMFSNHSSASDQPLTNTAL